MHPSSLVLSTEMESSASEVALSAGSNVISAVNTTTGAFGAGEAISGAGIPAETTIAKVGPGKITLSQDITESGTSVALASALSYNAAPSQIQSALESLPAIGHGNAAVSGENGSLTVELQGSLANSAEPLLGSNGSGLTPGGASATTAITTQGGDGWGTAKSANANILTRAKSQERRGSASTRRHHRA